MTFQSIYKDVDYRKKSSGKRVTDYTYKSSFQENLKFNDFGQKYG